MADGKRSQEVEGVYKKNKILYFYNGTIIIGEDKKISGNIHVNTGEETLQGNLEGRLEKIDNRNYLIFSVKLPYSKQYHILRKADLDENIIGRYSGQRYGINNIDDRNPNDNLLPKISYKKIPEELEKKARGGSIFYLGISENQYYWNKKKEKIKRFFQKKKKLENKKESEE